MQSKETAHVVQSLPNDAKHQQLQALIQQQQQLEAAAAAAAAAIKPGYVPLDHPEADKWFYLDPQNQVQGPFGVDQMAAWFSAGYFTFNLMVKKGSEDKFVPLGKRNKHKLICLI